MIKNVLDMSLGELHSYKKAYIRYFKYQCDFIWPGYNYHTSRIILRLNANKFASLAIRDILNGRSISYANVNDSNITSFMTGYNSEGRNAIISHIYSNDSTYNNTETLEVYKALVENLKKKGIETVKTSTCISSSLNDSLKSLGFTVAQTGLDSVEYERQL